MRLPANPGLFVSRGVSFRPLGECTVCGRRPNPTAPLPDDAYAARLFVGFNVRGVSTAIGDAKERMLQDTTPLGDTWPEHGDTGIKKGEYSTDGFYDDATGSINQALADSVGVSRVVCYGLESNTIGKKFVGLAGAFVGKYVRTVQLNEHHRAKGEYQVSGAMDDGVILHALTAETATGNTEGADSQDNAASSAAGGAGYLQVSAISGTGATIDAKIRHSSDDVTYADLITFAQIAVASSRGAERKTVSGTVNRHLACSFTIAGTTPSVTFFIGFARG